MLHADSFGVKRKIQLHYEECKKRNFLHTPPSNTLYHVGCPSLPSHNIQGAFSLHPSLPRTLVATPSRRSRVCLSHLAASIQSSRVQTRRERERQSERNHWRCGAKYGKRTTRQPSIRASEKQAQAEVNPLSSSSITVATCECLLLRSLPRPPPSPPACTPCSSSNPSPSVGCLAARDRRFRCALTEFGPGFGLEALDSCGCFPSAARVQLVKAVLRCLEAQICSAKRKLSDRMDDAVRASKRVRGVCVLRDCRHSLTDAY